jgi:TPR repeat protein
MIEKFQVLMIGDILYKKALTEASKDNPDIDRVLNLLNEAIKKENPRAFYALGSWYLHGKNVKKDFKKAVTLLKKAADKNISSANFDLAICYETGVGAKKDDKKAFECYLKAALEGDKQAYYEVGRCYYYGIGITKDEKIGNIWLDKAQSLGIK